MWKVSLPLAPDGGASNGLQPVLNGAGSEAVLAEGHSLIALRLSDGHRLWRHVFPQARNNLTGQLTFLYGFHGEVIALVGQVSTDSRLVALSEKTGAVVWTLPLGRYAVLGSPVVTADGVLAFLTPRGVLRAVSLWTGKLLWSRGFGTATGQPVLAADGTRLIAARSSGAKTPSPGSVSEFASQTGKQLWTRTGMPEQPTLLDALGGVLVYDVDQDVYPQPALFPVTQLNPVTGNTEWRIPTAAPVSAVWSSPQTPAIAIAAERWHAPPVPSPTWSRAASCGRPATSADADTTALADAGRLIYAKTAASPVTLVARDAASGLVRWSLRVPAAFPRYLVAVGGRSTLFSYGQLTVPGKAGALIIGATGKVIAKISLPAPAQAPPAVTAGYDTLLQLDTLACATASAGGAAGGT